MHTRDSTDGMGLGQAAKTVSERASSIARLEVELATLELKQKAANLGFGIGLGIGSAVFVFFAIGVGIATVVAALAIVLDVWLSLLIVFLTLLLVAGVLGALAASRLQRGTPPLPEQAIEEARRTTAAIRTNGGGQATEATSPTTGAEARGTEQPTQEARRKTGVIKTNGS